MAKACIYVSLVYRLASGPVVSRELLPVAFTGVERGEETSQLRHSVDTFDRTNTSTFCPPSKLHTMLDDEGLVVGILHSRLLISKHTLCSQDVPYKLSQNQVQQQNYHTQQRPMLILSRMALCALTRLSFSSPELADIAAAQQIVNLESNDNNTIEGIPPKPATQKASIFSDISSRVCLKI